MYAREGAIPGAPTRLARLLVIWLLVTLGLQLLNAVLSGFEIKHIFDGLDAHLARRPEPTRDELDFYIFIAGNAWLASTLVTAGFALIWTYRVDRNAHQFAEGLTVQPAWAVGWYFIPVAGLWMPFRALREAWQASVDSGEWKTVPVPTMLPLWWALWLVTTHLTAYSIAVSSTEITVGEGLELHQIDILTAALTAPQTLLFIQVVKRLTANQAGRFRARAFD